jgi:hypothetical protein
VLDPGSALSLIAAMATSRWVGAMRDAAQAPRGDAALKAHVEAGRVAYRVLASLRRNKGLAAGVGHLVSAVVVAEFTHGNDRPFIVEQIEEGLDRALTQTSLKTEDRVMEAASRALREGALLLERLAAEAEPATQRLLEEADGLEQKVERELSAR